MISGKHFDVFIQKRIFDPLNMEDTGLKAPEAKMNRFISIYAPVGLFDSMKPGLVKAEDFLSEPHSSRPKFLSGGGGLAGTHSWMLPTQYVTGFCLTERKSGF